VTMTRIHGLIGALLLAGVASPTLAQRTPASRCRVDTTAAWYAKQRAFLDESKRDWTNDSLRTVLLATTGTSAASPLSPQLGFHVVGRDTVPFPAGDTQALIAQLRSTPRGGPWPLRSSVGAAGTRAMLALARRDSAFAPMVMHRMMEAGESESLGADVATLEDQLRLAAGRKQLFGTQFRVDDNGRVVLAPMEDSAHADMRREGAGLPPLATSLCLASSPR
jgi:Family of unknown function (DUF6624)